VCEAAGAKGTLLLAQEGINGTIAAPREGVEAVLCAIRALPGCDTLDVKFSAAPVMPFGRMKVRVKREIVTMGEPGVDPSRSVGHYVDPADWNALIADPETLVIDTRNDYEVAIGSFAGAVDPQTPTFRDFPAWFRANRDTLLAGKTKVAMFCTGGIRCEKSTALLRAEGVDQVYHLRGGILKYLEEVPEEASFWQGECFVFDERVSLGHGLAPGTHTRCQPCGRPFPVGESCPVCEA
jgi:UPF0176 protein